MTYLLVNTTEKIKNLIIQLHKWHKHEIKLLIPKEIYNFNPEW